MKLDPTFVETMKEENRKLVADGLGEHLPTVQDLVRMWETACPKLTKALKAEGILDQTANVLNHQVQTAARAMPGDYAEARQQMERELIPFDPETEAAFLSPITVPDAKTAE